MIGRIGLVTRRAVTLAQRLPMSTGVTPAQQQAAAKIAEVDHKIRTRHEELHIPKDANADEVRRKRMIYRSKQRGWLEVDLLLGSWAEKNVPKLSAKELDEYDLILREETIDVYNYVSGKDALPEHLQNLKVMKDLQVYALSSKALDPETYATFKRENRLT
eukprot:gene3703-3957_t